MNKEQRGDIIATAVWRWLEGGMRVELVPWILDPGSPAFDAVAVARQDERMSLLHELRDLIVTTARLLNQDKYYASENREKGVLESITARITPSATDEVIFRPNPSPQK